jgi:hypothetical protein
MLPKLMPQKAYSRGEPYPKIRIEKNVDEPLPERSAGFVRREVVKVRLL